MVRKLGCLLALVLGITFTSTCALSGDRRGDGFMLEFTVIEQDFNYVMEGVEEAHRLGATHFIIPVLLCQENKNSNQMGWCDSRATDSPATRGLAITSTSEHERLERIARIARELHLRGFSTGIMPFLIGLDGSWRGDFAPDNFKTWSQTYVEILNKLAAVAQEQGISEFILGTEYNKLYIPTWPWARKEHAKFWTEQLNQFRKKLNPPAAKPVSVFLISNWDQFEDIPFWGASDYIALSSYYPLVKSHDSDTSIEALVSGWLPWADKLLSLSKKHRRPLYFAEVGYSSRSDAALQPWHYGEPVVLDHQLQVRLYSAFQKVWGSSEERFRRYGTALERFTIWALSRTKTPLEDSGYTVFGKPVEPVVGELFRERAKLRGEPEPQAFNVIFTLDDIPMWFVMDTEERVANYQRLREILVSRGVPTVAFVNPGFVMDPREWDELRSWRDAGIVLGNHNARHLVRSRVGDEEFFSDFAEGEATLNREVPGWDRAGRFYRFPNSDWGPVTQHLFGLTPDRATVETCNAITSHGYDIFPVTLRSEDWKRNEAYHKVAATDLGNRPSQGAPAQEVARQMLEELDQKVAAARQNSRAEPYATTAHLFIIHSARFTRDYLPHILTRMERQGVRWVAPTAENRRAYAPGPRCVPLCFEKRQCF